MSLITLALTMGDPAGIGPEIILKLLNDRGRFPGTAFVVCGSEAVLEDATARLKQPCSWCEGRPSDVAVLRAGEAMILEPPGIPDGPFCPGELSREAGRAAMLSVKLAVDLAKAGTVDGLVTAPINKEAIALAGFSCPGHTEFLAQRTGTDKVIMMLCSEKLRVSLVTVHQQLRAAVDSLSTDAILECIRITADGLRRYFGIENPRLAVAGLNPHAGEGGRFGDEEVRIIAPAISLAKESGINCTGPQPPDTVFVQAVNGHFDVVVCMYHDQGLIPLKLLSFGRAVNVTLGLPIVRTSVDHGTAFDIAGKGVASVSSLVEAVRLATNIVGNLRTDGSP